MKKLFILFFTMVLSFTALAQLQVKVGSFREVPGFINLNPDIRYDDNGKLYAVLKIKTEGINDKERQELSFGGDLQTYFEVEYQIGEVWLYISYYATYIKISHRDFGSTEFYFPSTMIGQHGYEMTLVYADKPVERWGTLKIITKPEDEATITLNGKVLEQKTPYTNEMLPAGKYEIIVSKERFKTVTEMVYVNDGNVVNVDIIMPIDVAEITLEADNKTKIFVDDVLKKKGGSWKGELKSGSHKIVYKKPSHNDAEKTIVVEPGVNQTYELEPIPIFGALDIKSTPVGADIYIDNKKIGTTPKLIKDVLIGERRVLLKKNNYTDFYEDIEIVENKETSLNVTLSIEKNTKKRNKGSNIGSSDIFPVKLKKYDFITLDMSLNQYGNLAYGVSLGQMEKIGWYLSLAWNFVLSKKYIGIDLTTNQSFIYECDANFFVGDYYPEYTGNDSYSSLSIMGGLLVRVYKPLALRVGAGLGSRQFCYETISGIWVRNKAISNTGLDAMLGLQCKFDWFLLSVDCVTTNFNAFEIKLGLGYAIDRD